MIAFALLLIAPAAARWYYGMQFAPPAPHEALRLVILTPNDQDIRNEFTWAFSEWHRKKFGSPVDLDFRTPGSTNDITREIENFYRQLARSHGGKLPPEGTFLPEAQLVWGGGDVFFNDLKKAGILRPLDFPPSFYTDVFPQASLNGVALYDSDQDAAGHPTPHWVGGCLSSFGIIYNPDLYQAMNIPAPITWADLSNPRLNGSVALADPTHSGSAAVAYEMVLQKAMADAVAKISKKTLDKNSPAYAQALSAGWKTGMGQLLCIAANARYFSDGAQQGPNDVAAGDAAAGMAIDFYAHVTEETVGSNREQFVLPAGATAITPDPIAILYGVTGEQLTLSQQFIQFLLSEEGQKLWILNPGEPDGPRNRALRRAPIRRSVYRDQTGWADNSNYFTESGGFNEHSEWMKNFPETRLVWAAAWIDDRDDLRAAWEAILANPSDTDRDKLIAQLADLPITLDDVNKMTADRIAEAASPTGDIDLWRAQLRTDLAARFRDHYRQVETAAQPEASQ